MRLDLTRSTFRPDRGYSGVVVQQGRVQLDADANEASDIAVHRARTTAVDVIGAAGTPRDGDSFRVFASGGELFVTPGRIWVGGVLVASVPQPLPVLDLATDTALLADLGPVETPVAPCQWLALHAEGHVARLLRVTDVDTATRTITFAPSLPAAEADAIAAAGATVTRVYSYTSQPYLPEPPHTTGGGDCPLPDLDDGVWAVYLDVWERAVTAREDPHLREPALGGPDTTARTQVVWQLRLAHVDPDPDADVGCDLPPEPPPGGLQARAQPQEETATDCEVPAGAGYRRLDNQLYRVEIHDGDEAGPATFKWSGRNGAVSAAWTDTDARTLIVDDATPDPAGGFSPGDRVELTDRTRELAGRPGVFVEVETVDDAGLHLTADPPPREDFDAHALVRRWDDSAGPRMVERPADNEGWLALADGVEVRFTATGNHRTGDYWLIPARTATGDVEWPRGADDARTPLVRRPDGVTHHRCVLALVRRDGGAPADVTDCRPLFPPLTDLRAGDVIVQPGVCDLPAGTTVQQTLEQLCQQRDLRHHNRHLHGWGIVCGLQVTCGPDEDDRTRAHVTVHDGYAIDRAGNDLLQPDATIDLLALVEEQAPDALDDNGDGDVCLTMALDAGRTAFGVQPYDPQDDDDPFSELLTGTLLADVYDDCIQPLQQFLEEELRPPEDEETAGVHPARERLAALTNLLVQPVNPSTGQHVFVSPREHEVLRRLYDGLRELLRSTTFCAMFDDARPFPDYPFENVGLDTIFGRGSHERLRVRPGGREAYTVGPGANPTRPLPRLNRYDLERATLVATIDPLAGGDLSDGGDSGAGAVQDVAFSPDGRQIFVIAPTRNEQNTFFRAGLIRGDTIDWQPVVTICGIKLVTLATTEASPNAVYAVGVVDEPPEDGETRAGLYEIVPGEVDPNMEPIARFNAVGHLVVDAAGQAFATAAAEDEAATAYSRVRSFRLPGAEVLTEFAVPEGVDDLAVRPLSRSTRTVRVYTVAGPTPEHQRFVVAHDVRGNAATFVGDVEVDDTTIALAPFPETGMLLVTSEDGYSLRLIDLEEHELAGEYLLPLQVGPLSVAAVGDRNQALVLNYVSNTVMTAEARVLTPGFETAPLLEQLADYRAAAIEAYADLLGGFLQYLKDCLCDKFLVACPTEDGPSALSLACVSIRGNQVYRVCNFSRRRYVKSFPTVEYWLSAVPLLPLLRKAFEEFCCAVLPDVFSRYTVEREVAHEGTGRVSVDTVRTGTARAQAFDLPGRLFQARRAVDVSSGLATESLGRAVALPARPGRDMRLAVGTVVGQPVDRAERLLRDRGLDVRHVPFRPDVLGQLTTRLIGLLRTPQPGGEVTLEVEDDRVRSYRVSGDTETVALRRTVTSLADTVSAREAEISELHAVTASQQERLHGVEELQTTVSEAASRLAERDEEIRSLRSRLDQLERRTGRPDRDVTPRALDELQEELAELRDFRDRVQRFMDERDG